jgi:hypothetical protein
MKGPIKKHIVGLGWLELGLALAGLAVVFGLMVESGPELWDALMTNVWPARGVLGGVVVTIGVLAEVIIGVLIAQEARHKEREANLEIAAANDRAAKAEQGAAEANLARAKLESQLLRSIGPRTIAPEQGEHIVSKLNTFLPDVSFVVLVIGATGADDAIERSGFARQIADMVDRETSIFQIASDVTPWELRDVWIRVPSSELRWSVAARTLFSIFREEGIMVAGSTYFDLPSVVFRLERNGGAISVVAPHRDLGNALGIVIGKRSQPIFRLEERET